MPIASNVFFHIVWVGASNLPCCVISLSFSFLPLCIIIIIIILVFLFHFWSRPNDTKEAVGEREEEVI